MTEPYRPPARGRLLITRLVALSGFQRKALLAALVLSLAGVVGYGSSYFDKQQTEKLVAVDQMPAPRELAVPQGSGFVSSSGKAVSTEKPKVEEVTPKQTWAQWTAPWATRLGFGFLGGFAVGFASRTFIKTMTIIVAVAGSVFLGLSYFNVLNIDFSRVETVYHSNADWLTTQADKLKDVIMAKLPSTTAAFAGLFVGFMRRG